MSTERIISEETKQAYKRLIDAFAAIDINGITILTGNNGSGKSLIRKQLPFKFKTEYELEDISETKGMIKSTSMDDRTSSNSDWGALSGLMRDTEWIATSQNTLHSIKNLISAVEDGKTKYLVIDEYEIGCSEETIAALADYISENLNRLIEDEKLQGAMIITHSRVGLKRIKHDHFVNMEGLNEIEWLNREIVPTNLEYLDENELFFCIRDNQNSH